MRERVGQKIKLKSVEEILGVVGEESAMEIEIYKIHPFKDHPFHVVDDDRMKRLVDSIRENGILVPAIVRSIGNDEYEMISGHRRMHAAQKLGMKRIPVIIREMSDDEAIVKMVDSNIQREELLPSEKAFAYKMKMDAMKRQGQRTDLTSSQVATKLDTAADIGAVLGESRDKVFRFIRLTNLIPELLELVDRGDIALNTAVGLSYLKPYEQRWVQEAIEYEGCTPSLSQACRLKNASKTGSLDQDDVFLMMQEEKPNQRCTIKISRDELLRYFPRNYTDGQIKQAILQSLEYLRRQRLREERDTR